MKTYELIIIGGGPAGVSAGIYAARRRIDTLLISKEIGGQAFLSYSIENYPGLYGINGFELSKKFKEHLYQFESEIEIREGAEVEKVEQKDRLFLVRTREEEFLGKTLIIATGARHRQLNVPGEERLKGGGVSYCANCDAPLYKNKTVAVVGGGDSAMDAALYLEKIGAKKVFVINKNPQFKGDEVSINKINLSKNIEVVYKAMTLEIIGNEIVTGIKIKVDDKEKTINIDGVFVAIGMVPNSEIVDFVEKNQRGEIIIDCQCQTSVPGLFAAGDVTSILDKQIIIAAGEGAKAVLTADRYLEKLK